MTQRVKTISQPRGGYVPRRLFCETQYNDNNEIREVEPAFSSMQGTVVDYLTRFFISHDKLSAFSISIEGAKCIDEVNENNDEYNHVSSLLEKVTGLDDTSIYNACKIVGYDTALRRGVNSYQDVERISPPYDVISNIRILITRSLEFLYTIGPVVSDGFTFEDGYTNLVSTGDGDYLTKDTLIDLKVSKSQFSSQWSLQLLMYYLLGIHSKGKIAFQTIELLCVFNPIENKSYICHVKDISDEIKYKVSHEVIGYKMLFSDYSRWNEVKGTDHVILEHFFKDNSRTNFNSDNYSDGIHEISIDDYWTYLRSVDAQNSNLRPKFSRTEAIIMIKRNGYLMFLSQSHKGTLNVLNGGSLQKAAFSPEYYYENIERYADAVMSRFKKYWDALFAISDRLKAITPDKEQLRKTQYSDYIKKAKICGIKPLKFEDWYAENGYNYRFSGNVHGCIIDIDFLNHLYLNPYDGTLVPYSADSMFDKDVYKNTPSLISAKRPEMLEAFTQACTTDNEVTALLVSANDVTHALVDQSGVIDKDFVKVYSTDMYAISRRLKPLQSVYDKKLIQVWYDSILQEDIKQFENKYLLPSPKQVPRIKTEMK